MKPATSQNSIGGHKQKLRVANHPKQSAVNLDFTPIQEQKEKGNKDLNQKQVASSTYN
jgi:hypothetical protein